MELVNATGVLVATYTPNLFNPFHVSVSTRNPNELKAWQDTRGTSNVHQYTVLLQLISYRAW